MLVDAVCARTVFFAVFARTAAKFPQESLVEVFIIGESALHTDIDMAEVRMQQEVLRPFHAHAVQVALERDSKMRFDKMRKVIHIAVSYTHLDVYKRQYV